MRRFVFAALIGGFIGFAVLLQIAADNAGCWGYGNLHFGSIVMMPVTVVRISDLMHSARVLIFQMEIVNSGFEFFIRGAGAAIILLMVFDVIEKRAKRLSIEPLLRWTTAHEETVYTTLLLAGMLFGLYIFLQILFSIIQISHFAFAGILDATTVAILFPSILLNTLVLAAAHKKRLFLWQIVSTRNESSIGKLLLSIILQLSIFSLSIVVGIYLMEVFQSSPFIGSLQFGSSYDANLAPVTFSVVASSWSACFIAYVGEVFAFVTIAQEPWKIALKRGLCLAYFSCFCLHWILPAVWLFFLSQSIEGALIRQSASDIFRMCCACSTFSSSFLGLSVAFAPRLRADGESAGCSSSVEPAT
ncbi:MAG: hypothetical protein DKT66_22880 [Candidatus Melainabacteria bacterium]|nr:MAG: hypothetical protein DKT66_22880 [Candidatus Melainabacteria bacterium]